MNSIEVRDLSKSYSIYGSPVGRLTELITFNAIKRHEEFWALRDVSFSIEKGESFGIIGVNGSGKSTLLQILAGILNPTRGSVKVTGRVSAILELGSGFNAEFTGRENVYLNAAILGMSRTDIDHRFAEIESFAEIGNFVDQPVKTYSSGMVMRLAFAVAINVDPDILIVDEALAVGDAYFRQRCLRRIHHLRDGGVTIVFVSHLPGDLKALCDRCLWLDHGKVAEIGTADAVLGRYLAATVNKAALPQNANVAATRHRFGNQQAEIIDATIPEEVSAGLPVTLRVTAKVRSALCSPIIGFNLRNAKGETLWGTNTLRENVRLDDAKPGEVFSCDFSWTMPELRPEQYTISVGVSTGTLENFEVCDYVEDLLNVTVTAGSTEVRGYLHLPCEISVMS